MNMNLWLALLYGAIAVVALRSLFTLMDQHRRVHLYKLQELAKEEAQKQAALEAEQKQQEAEQAESEQNSKQAA
ncbi:MAG: hypothetical protein JKY95_09505 [Planctomycetaceae bacterium]|nr:hypothetical protein [Planctomycetaceae bacterium]